MKVYPENLRHCQIKQLVDRPDPVILELGAHYGEDSQGFLDTFPECRLFCFEPRPSCIEVFKRRISDPRCTLIEMAVMDKDGETPLRLSGGTPPSGFPDPECKDWDYSSSISEPTGELRRSPWISYKEIIQVSCRRLDTWLGQNPEFRVIDFIWCDIQGVEHLAIAGGYETFLRTRYFYTEFADDPQYADQRSLAELAAMLPDFRVVAIYGGENALFTNVRRGDLR